LGTVRGQEVALPTHFHEEDQITFVLSGRRNFVIAGKLVDVPPGQGTHIPAGTPHHSLSASSEVIAINIYTAPSTYAASDLIAALSRFWPSKENIDWSELAVIVEEHRCFTNAATVQTGGGKIGAESWETVGQAAQLAGMSREGFSRRFRRLQGMPPLTFRIVEKLNVARKLLRAGEPIAAVAAETGFSDQSHMGRFFRRAFGVTPGQYRVR
jgi:AraC-like DNA-binding protein